MYNDKTDEEILDFFNKCESKERAYIFLGIDLHKSRTERLKELQSVCDSVGYDSELLDYRNKKRKEKEDYNNNPILCKQCGKPIPYEKRLVKKFCNSSCAAKFNNSKRTITENHKTNASESIKRLHRRTCEWKGKIYKFNKPEAKEAYDSGEVDMNFMIEFFPDIVKKCKTCGKYFLSNFIESGRRFDGLREYCSEDCSRRVYKKVNWMYSTDSQNSTYRMKKKKQLVEYKGGCCSVCGYNRCLSALEFHHLDPNEKDISITKLVGGGYSIEKAKEELDKCILLCSNCHREVHSGVISLDGHISSGHTEEISE